MRKAILVELLLCVFVIISAYDKCGIPKIKPMFNNITNNNKEGQIVGGEEAIPHSYPWMISLSYLKEQGCGGSILNEQWIITAAHCLPDIEEEYTPYTIVTGEHNLAIYEGTESIYHISSIVYYYYNSYTLHNDIALVKLKSNITFNEYVQPICLPEYDSEYSGSYVATGWGLTEGTGKGGVLRQVRLSHIDRELCNSTDVYNGAITDSMMCAGDLSGGVDTCSGDSGGPLIAMHKDSDDVIYWVLQGITSGGTGCAGINKPGIYTNVANFVQWIEETIHD